MCCSIPQLHTWLWSQCSPLIKQKIRFPLETPQISRRLCSLIVQSLLSAPYMKAVHLMWPDGLSFPSLPSFHHGADCPVKGGSGSRESSTITLKSTISFLHIDGIFLEWLLHFSLFFLSAQLHFKHYLFIFPFLLLNQRQQQHHLLKYRFHW